jgi:hypothetical protein
MDFASFCRNEKQEPLYFDVKAVDDKFDSSFPALVALSLQFIPFFEM